MEEREYLIILYDFYSELLNEKQKQYFEDYYFNNLSLGEISENENVSRNAVHKSIKKVENELYFYEEKLKLYQKNQQLNELIEKILVHQTEKIDGKKVQEIDIHYRGVGIISFPVSLEDMTMVIEKMLNKKISA